MDIEVLVDREKIRYTAYHIVKAFFPEDKVKVTVKAQSKFIEVHIDTAKHIYIDNLDVARFILENNLYNSKISLNQDEVSLKSQFQEINKSIEENQIINNENSLEYNQIIDIVKKLDDKSIKYCCDRILYDRLVGFTGKKLPWGILTGVRPVKLISEIADGKDLVQFFENDYRVSKEKANLALHIARTEDEVLKKINVREGYSLYIGIPFCPSICSYCSFGSGDIHAYIDKIDKYIDILLEDLRETIRFANERNKILQTIYIGGGTPTSINEIQLERLLTGIDNICNKSNLIEYTIEAGRPDTLNEEKLKIIKTHNINRISINPQTMNSKTLDLIGRRHTPEDIKDVVILARKMGFDNINMDLIMGLPGEDIDDVKYTLEQIKEIGPDNLTVHSLSIKRASRMGEEKTAHENNIKVFNKKEKDNFSSSFALDKSSIKSFSNSQGEKEETVTNEISTMLDLAHEKADEMGLHPYYLYRQKNIAGNFENIGYAKNEKEGIYNIIMMEEVGTILGVGAKAMTKVVLDKPVKKGNRYTNIIRDEEYKDIDLYINKHEDIFSRKMEMLKKYFI